MLLKNKDEKSLRGFISMLQERVRMQNNLEKPETSSEKISIE